VQILPAMGTLVEEAIREAASITVGRRSPTLD
jgi:hypothetical protein